MCPAFLRVHLELSEAESNCSMCSTMNPDKSALIITLISTATEGQDKVACFNVNKKTLWSSMILILVGIVVLFSVLSRQWL